LAENDWDGFRAQTAALGGRIQIVGDDLLVTNPIYIRRAIAGKECTAALIKLNQIGTVTETIDAIQLCRKAGWGYVISHRSGETEDTFIADFAVAMGGGQIQDRIIVPVRTDRQVQPITRDRSGIGSGSSLLLRRTLMAYLRVQKY